MLDRKRLVVAYALKDAAIIVGPSGRIAAAEFDPALGGGLTACFPDERVIRHIHRRRTADEGGR